MVSTLSRRDFMHHLGVAVVAAHLPDAAPRWDAPGEAARLAECELLSGVPIAAMRSFYGETIGLPTSLSGGSLLVHAGSTRLEFVHDDSAGKPFYHFAFNIPENKIRLAREWQL